MAFSTGCVATFNFLFLYLLMRRQLHGLESARLLVSLAKVVLACVPLAAVCAASRHWLFAAWPIQALAPKIAAMAVTVLVGVSAFAATGMLLRIDELKLLWAAVRRRLRR